jgi:riboflavin kinase / FMN adenylyltransferase
VRLVEPRVPWLTSEPFPLIFPDVMNVYYDLKEYRGSLPRPVVTMGNFDGIHRGHQEIFRILLREAVAGDGTALVITFFPHPLKVLHPGQAPRLITSLEDRIALIRCCGIDHVLLLPFTEEFATWSPERFIRDILVRRVGAKKVLVGEDFRFGRDRGGDIVFLENQGEAYGYTVQRINPVRIDGLEVSSTRIRQFIQNGQVRESAKMLGRPYSISGKVVSGDRRGKHLGFPTANLASDAEIIPPNGVYAVWVNVKGDRRPGVASLGIKPTFSGTAFSIEVHIFDFHEEIYGESLRMEFIEWLREERSFPDPRALVEQIGRDAQEARRILQQGPWRTLQPPDTSKTGTRT